jgi:hypothetical protein
MGIPYNRNLTDNTTEHVSGQLNDVNIDDINFLFGSDKKKIHLIHFENVIKHGSAECERLNNIVKNRNVKVIFLGRKDNDAHVLSRLENRYRLQGKDGQRFLKKDLEMLYNHTMRNKKRAHPSNNPFNIDEWISYEDLLEPELNLFGNNIDTSKYVWNMKLPPKSQTIKNYDQVMKWMKELDKKYDEFYI